MQFVSQTHAVALNCLSSQRCIALLFGAEEMIKKTLTLMGQIVFWRRRGNAIVYLSEFFSADFRLTDKIRRRRPNSATQGSTIPSTYVSVLAFSVAPFVRLTVFHEGKFQDPLR